MDTSNGWGFLKARDPHLRPAEKLIAYLVSRIDGGGPDWTLTLPDVSAIQDALEQAGLIELYDNPSAYSGGIAQSEHTSVGLRGRGLRNRRLLDRVPLRPRDRGLGGVQLVISDHHRGLMNAIDATMAGATWQRCRVHYAYRWNMPM